MKKYIKLIPVIFYPYAYILAIAVFYFSDKMASQNLTETAAVSFSEGVQTALLIATYLYISLTLASAIASTIIIASNQETAYSAAKQNLIVKCVQIPAYIFHFLMGLFSLAMSVWGVGFLMLAIVMDVTSIALTGIHALGCIIKIRKSKVISTTAAVFAVIGSFTFCIDLIVAIILTVVSRKTKKLSADGKATDVLPQTDVL